MLSLQGNDGNTVINTSNAYHRTVGGYDEDGKARVIRTDEDGKVQTTASGTVSVASVSIGAYSSQGFITSDGDVKTLEAGQRIRLRNQAVAAVAWHTATGCTWNTTQSDILHADTSVDAGNGGFVEFVSKDGCVVSIDAASGSPRVHYTVWDS